MVKFNENNSIKLNMYPSNKMINSRKYWPIIIITHEK